MSQAEAASTTTALTIADLNTTINHEPRILDTLLAARLGFERPRAIRQIIKRNKAEIETYGSIATRRGDYRGHETEESFLNEGQALVICALSRTPKAAEVRKALIDVFMAWQSGQLTPPPPAAPHPPAPGLTRMTVGAREVVIDASAYEIGDGQEAVVCGHDGQISVLPGPLSPSCMTMELGKRSVVGPMRLTQSDGLRNQWKGTMYIVLGRVVPADQAEPTKPVRVRQHRRALPTRGGERERSMRVIGRVVEAGGGGGEARIPKAARASRPRCRAATIRLGQTADAAGIDKRKPNVVTLLQCHDIRPEPKGRRASSFLGLRMRATTRP